MSPSAGLVGLSVRYSATFEGVDVSDRDSVAEEVGSICDSDLDFEDNSDEFNVELSGCLTWKILAPEIIREIGTLRLSTGVLISLDLCTVESCKRRSTNCTLVTHCGLDESFFIDDNWSFDATSGL